MPAERLRGKHLELRTSSNGVHNQLMIPLEGEIFATYSVDVERFHFGPIDGRPENYEPRRIRIRQMSGYRVGLDRATLEKGYRLIPRSAFEATEEAKPDGFDLVLRLKEDARGYGPLNGYIQMQIKVSGRDLDVESFSHSPVRLNGTWEQPMWPPGLNAGRKR